MSWLFSRALVEASSGESSSGGEPSAPLNLMPTPRPFLLSDKTMAFSTPSQFGLTCRPLTDDRGEVVLMSFLVAFPVRTSAPPAVAPGSTGTNPASGWKWPESFVKYDPATRSWRTRQCSLLEDSTLYSETWPRWGSMQDGECSVRPTPALRISVSGSGLWPTPKASEAGPDFAAFERGKSPSLQTMVALYPTPRSTDGDRGGRGDLIQAVRGNPNKHYKSWPTPHGFSKDGRSNGPSGNELGRAVNQRLTKDGLYTTPCADDTGHRKKPYAQGGVALSSQVGGSLNPDWVEWLMGWLIGWTDCAPLGMDRFQQWRRSHGKR